jgi:hypothetical protein
MKKVVVMKKGELLHDRQVGQMQIVYFFQKCKQAVCNSYGTVATV